MQEYLNKIKAINRSLWIAAAIGLLMGYLWIGIARYILLDDPVHYHANFLVYINGERQKFDNPLYYEEVSACSAETSGPRARVHLHEPDSDVVHVHDEGSTWGNLFENLGWSLGDDFVRTDTEFFIDNDNKDLVFILNGERTRTIANQTIGDLDRLLISYDKPGLDTTEQFNMVASNAPEFNQTADPGACKGSDEESWTGRLKRAFWM